MRHIQAQRSFILQNDSALRLSLTSPASSEQTRIAHAYKEKQVTIDSVCSSLYVSFRAVALCRSFFGRQCAIARCDTSADVTSKRAFPARGGDVTVKRSNRLTAYTKPTGKEPEMSKFNLSAMSAAATKNTTAELKELEARVNLLGGQVIGPVQQIIDSVKLDDSDPVAVQIEKTKRIIVALEPIAAAVQATVKSEEQPRRRGRNNEPDTPPPSDTSDKRRPDGPRPPKDTQSPAKKKPSEPAPADKSSWFGDLFKRDEA